MQMMMMSAMTNQAPITISDNTKKHRRRILDEDQVNEHVVELKCKMLYYTEICVTFDAVNNDCNGLYIAKELKPGMKSIEKELMIMMVYLICL